MKGFTLFFRQRTKAQIQLCSHQTDPVQLRSKPTFFLEPLEEALCRRHQAPEAEAAPQLGAQQSEGLEVGGVVEVVAVLLQPVADHR